MRRAGRGVFAAPEGTVPAGLTIADLLAEPRHRYRHSAFPVAGDDGRSPAGRAPVVDDSGGPVGILASSDVSRAVSWLMTAPTGGRRDTR
ncbi:CBS domain-containing protein [Streptomyces polychromogenes]|nr:CBS domain-containing protein [Streptomyces polychromogenes]